jgi:hypothetical protein
MGDAVGRWDGDTLVIDTVGIRVDQYTSIDRFGTPQSDQMHVVERYRLIDGRRPRRGPMRSKTPKVQSAAAGAMRDTVRIRISRASSFRSRWTIRRC